MAELTSRVTKSVVSEKRSAPAIIREGGKARGRHETVYALVPVGAVVTVELKINGKVERVLGPWTGEAQAGKNAIAGVMFQVGDSCSKDNFDIAEVEVG